MQILNVDGKKRQVLSLKKIAHQIPDALHEGQYINVPYVEIVIKGKNMTWKNWVSLKEFQEQNPMVVIENGN